MPDDYGHDWTDEELEKLEKRIARVYRQASKDMQKNIEDYFARFVERDQKMRSLIGTIQNGKEWTEEDYKQWRLNQFGRGERFQHLRDRLAERATKANEVANAYINDLTPSVYSLNRNYAAYTIERVSGNVGFTLWDESTVRRLLVKQPDLMPYYPMERAIKRGIDLAWGKKQITNTITSAILRGLSIKGISEELRTRVPEMGLSSSIRAARTAITSAENAGRMDSYKAASDMGIKVRKRWVATKDGRTRHAHRRLDGQTVDWDESFSSELGKIRYPGDPRAKPANVYNCFTGDVKVASDSEVIRSYKHMYYGKLITIKTSGGVDFTCTPNHPILTPRGWIAAELLNDGDNILVTFRSNNVLSRIYPNIKHGFSRFDTFHKFMNMPWSNRAVGMSVNFHGDVSTSDVEIVTKKRFLRENRNPSGRNGVAKLFLKFPDKAFSSFCSFGKHILRVCAPALGDIGRKCICLSFLFGHIRHSDKHGFRPSTDMNVVLPEYSIDNSPAETMLKRELIDRLPGKVFLDHVVSVEVSSSNCHVYNLQTESGYYFVNSNIPQDAEMRNGIFAIAKNCRCTLRTVEKPGIEAESRKMRVKDPKTGRNVVVNEMTYDEWERWVKSRA